ncbi:MAG: hypothetical protein IJ479_01630 [Alphaproteobacteria bacterium]|jgi:hypothetical protein|nr:hypothetical protein [Alphaproteobacteria bacterium]MDY4841690.1 hypothetical protein [Alphaproteobacteria bacterium]
MIRLLLWLSGVAAACVLSYQLGRSHSRLQTVTKEIEVIKYVSAQCHKIASQPNLERNALLELMRRGQL